MRIPRVLNDLLPSETVKQFVDLVSQPNLVSGLKDAAQQLGWKEAWGSNQLQNAMLQTKKWLEKVNQTWAASEQEHGRVGINATGQFFSKQWTATPVDRSVATAMSAMMTGFSKSEGTRQRIEQSIAKTVSADAAIVTHSVELALSLLAQKSEYGAMKWAIARADCLRLTSGVDITTLLGTVPLNQVNEQGNTVIEVGAANLCSKDDWRRAAEAGATGFLMVTCRADSRIPRRSCDVLGRGLI